MNEPLELTFAREPKRNSRHTWQPVDSHARLNALPSFQSLVCNPQSRSAEGATDLNQDRVALHNPSLPHQLREFQNPQKSPGLPEHSQAARPGPFCNPLNEPAGTLANHQCKASLG